MEPYLYGAALVLTAALSVLCSVAEGALGSYSARRLTELLKDPERRRRVEAYLHRIERFGFTAAVANATADMLLVAVVALATRASGFGTVPAIAGALLLVLLFGELLPRVIGIAYADRLLVPVLSFMAVLEAAFAPLVWPLHRLHDGLLGLLSGGDPVQRRAQELLDELRSATLESEREGVLDHQEADMIESIIEYRNVQVREIMTPRTEMVIIEADATLEQAVELAVQCGHSRIPVYEGSRDHIVGVLYAKDALRHLVRAEGNGEPVRVRAFMRPPYFVPETKTIGSLLQEFRSRKVHIAIVLDEYGGTAGLVTIEDVLEEIVGEIEDEYDEAAGARPPLRQLGPSAAEVDARLRIEEVNEELGLELPADGEYETVGGLLMHLLGKVPAAGESAECGGVRLTVLEADERHVTRVRIEAAQPSAQPAA
ncbi:MAG: hemolysin [Planctomycetota bacterium]|nr:MAG: hemolysin [Planctomycetota bacterium]